MASLFLVVFFAAYASASQLVDLGYALDEDSINFPQTGEFTFIEKVKASTSVGIPFFYDQFRTGEHISTHMDAPYHFSAKGRKIDEIPVETLVARACLVNATEEAGGNPDYGLPVSKLEEWEEKYGPMPDNSVVLVDFGWGTRYPDVEAYLGGTKVEELRFPGLSREAGVWIANKPQVVGVGLDTPSADVAKNLFTPVHVVLAKHQKYIVENMNLNMPLPHSFNITLMPIKIKGGTGAPCRAIGII